MKNIGILTISSFSTKILSFLLVPIYTNVLSVITSIVTISYNILFLVVFKLGLIGYIAANHKLKSSIICILNKRKRVILIILFYIL